MTGLWSYRVRVTWRESGTESVVEFTVEAPTITDAFDLGRRYFSEGHPGAKLHRLSVEPAF